MPLHLKLRDGIGRCCSRWSKSTNSSVGVLWTTRLLRLDTQSGHKQMRRTEKSPDCEMRTCSCMVGNLTVANAGIQSRDLRIDQLSAELLRSDQKCRSLVDEAVATMSSQMDAREHDLRQHYEAQLENSRIMSEGLQAEIDRLSAEAAQAIAHESSWQPVGSNMPTIQVDQAQQHESLDDYMRNRVRSALDSGIGPLEGEKTRHHANAAVAGPPKPTLPITGELKEPHEGSFVWSSSLISAQDRGDATQELLKSLTKLLVDKYSESKPKVKEADTIKLADQPTPESYRRWKNAVREEIRAASDKPDKAWEWLAEVYDKNLKPAEKMEKLQESRRLRNA